MIKIITVQFGYDQDPKYKILLDALKQSAKVNMPDAQFIDLQIEPPEMEMLPGYRMLKSNTIKLEKWVEEIEKCNRRDKIALLDCDMLILKDFSKVFRYKFDVAYTYRTSGHLPLNGGVMFVKPTKLAKDFFRKFLETNNKMLNDVKFHLPWRRKYAGMNQAAMGYMLEESDHPAYIIGLPCPLWNVCNEDWHKILPAAYILHIKSRLRLMVLGKKKVSSDLAGLVKLWQDYYSNET